MKFSLYVLWKCIDLVLYFFLFQLSVDTNTVEFGTTVIGETLKRTFTLTNNGALGTKYEFFKLTGSKLRTVTTAETSLGRLVCSTKRDRNKEYYDLINTLKTRMQYHFILKSAHSIKTKSCIKQIKQLYNFR